MTPAQSLPLHSSVPPEKKKRIWITIYVVVSALLIPLLLFRQTHTVLTPAVSAAEEKQKTAELNVQAAKRAAIAHIESFEAQLASLRQSLVSTRQQSESYQTQMTDYRMNHKMAIAAILAGALGAKAASDESMTDNQRLVGGIAALVALAYAWSNHEEVVDVFNTLTRAQTVQSEFDARIKNLTKQINASEAEIAAEKQRLQAA